MIPGYGNFSRWFKGAVTHREYSQFIRETAFIIRLKICKKDNQIVIINDNAPIHKDQCVMDVVNENRINFFFTVPYSPQTNLPAENHFGRMKSACLFDHFIFHDNDFAINEAGGFDMKDDESQKQSQQLDKVTKETESTEKEKENSFTESKNSSKESTVNGTAYHYITPTNVVQKLDHFNMLKYDSDSSMNIFYAWETVLKDCKNGKALTGQH